MSHSETSINEEHNDKIDESENITIEEWIEDEDRQAEDFIEVDGIVDESNIGQEIVLNSEDDQILRQEDAGVSMIDDNAMMPIKTTAELTLNLPDLMSRVITFSNGSNMYLCFSKRCRRQISFDGYLYTIDGYLNVSGWNVWRCANPFCSGSVRTAPNFEELRLRTDHVEGCQADDTQVRLRITVYDLRLMSEFTEIPLNALYQAYLDKVMTEHPDIVHLFPPFETMKSTLEDHRKNNIYRKRFEMESREADTVMIESYSVAGQPVKFRRTKLFPPSLCMECAVEFRSSPDVPSHDQLVDHLFVAHDRSHAIIEQYTFSESSLFEQWIRDLQYHSRHRMKKMGLHDEHMYYLCQGDDRLFKSNHGRTALGGLHCSAFIRVHDWRLVMRRDVSEVVVDFCLEHSFHSDYEDYVEPELSTVWIPEGDGIFGEQRSCQRQEAMRQLQHGAAVRSNTVPNISEKKTRPVPFHITKRSSFADSSMYNHVLQLELQCDVGLYDYNMLKERMQSCRSVRAAKHYLGRVTNILDDVMADPRCAPAAIRQMDRKSLSSSGAQSLNEYDIDKQACPPHTTEESRETQGNLQACQDGRFYENVEVSPMVQASSSHFGGLVTNGQPVRQKVFVRRGKNGQMVVVKRTIVTKILSLISEFCCLANCRSLCI
uniref:C2H2-type domain-containing protein n=1 Tax=Heterorhabditis bacteriophora TaxID=37862 RepID=A0A1I7XPL0_HETBA